MKIEPTHQTASATISHGAGFGFLAGMCLPVGLMSLGVDLHLEDLSLVVAIAIFVGSPFVGMALLWGLFTVGVKILGRPAMAYVYTGLYLAAFAALGWIAGRAFSGGSWLAGVFGAAGLVVPNCALFYSRREYLYGEESAMPERSENPAASNGGDEAG